MNINAYLKVFKIKKLAPLTKENLVNFKRPEFEFNINYIKGNFIPTNEAIERLIKIKNFFDSRIPILL